MLIHGGSDALRCKILVGSLLGSALDWFGSLAEGLVTSLEVFVKLFVSHFAANKTKPSETTVLFEIRQAKGELVKQYLRRLNEVWCRFHNLLKAYVWRLSLEDCDRERSKNPW